MKQLTLHSTSEGETAWFGSLIGSLATAGDVFLFYGELGSGKTCLIRGIAAGLGVAEHAFSPSFVLIREYCGRLPLYHMDFYRLGSIIEVMDLGVEDYLYGDGVCTIEWADRAEAFLPPQRLRLDLAYDMRHTNAREIRISASGLRYETLLTQFKIAGGSVAAWK